MLEYLQNGQTPAVIVPMEYRAIKTDGAAPVRSQEDVPSPSIVRELEDKIRELECEIEARSRSFELDLESARVEARDEGRSDERRERADHIEEIAQRWTAALTEFAAERDRYLAQVEQEVVRLSLAIAERILHREAQMDPLLLAGAVRVALGQLADTSEVRLIVPALEQELWSEMLRLMPNLALRPELVTDSALSLGECRIETHVGSIDLGVRSQVAEIERGFFDLLEKREGTALTAQEPGAKREYGRQGSTDSVGD